VVQVAHRLAGSFPDGQFYVNLRGTHADPVDPTRALARFLRALGMDESALPEGLDERAEIYRQRIAGRRCLVVLDNAGSEEQVRPLLPGAPTCAVLITSRHRLAGLEGTHHLDLDVFEPDQATELMARIAGSDRVAAEVGGAADVARLCGYLPLAVRIASARLAARPHWRVAQLVQRLGDERRRLDELAAGDLDVRTSIGLSYDGLDDDSRRAFRLLGLYEVPDFTAWVVAALMDITDERAGDLVDDLVTAHLVEVVGTDPTGHIRYRCHDLVRLYARERAVDEETEGERRSALRRVFGAWLALAESADDRMPAAEYARIPGAAPRWRLDDHGAGSPPVGPMAWFEAERIALVSAVTQACSLEFDELAWELAGAALTFFDRRSFLDDWDRTHTLALECCRRTRNAKGRAVMARNLAHLGEVRGRSRLLPHADDAIEMSREIGNRQLEADARIVWGALHRHVDPAAARASIEKGLSLARTEGHVPAALLAQVWLGQIHREAGDHEAAARSAELCLESARRHDLPSYEVLALRLIGMSRREQGNFQESEDAFTRALPIVRGIGDRTMEARMLTTLGELYVRWGRAEARPILEQSLELAAGRDDFGRALAHRILGELDLSEQRYDDAVVHLRPALEYYQQMEYTYGEAMTLHALGDIHAAVGDADSAKSAWSTARRLFERLGDTRHAEVLTERLVKHDLLPADETKFGSR
jgi:tetratricopeptide (TPR) repeat protein